MSSIGDLVGVDTVDELATPSNARLGRAIFKADEVDVIDSDPEHVLFRVGGTTTGRRRVELRSAEDGLHWKCTCTSDPDLFCKHLVAATVSLIPSTA